MTHTSNPLLNNTQLDHLTHSLLPITVALHLSRSSRELGLATLFLWIVIQLTRRITQLVKDGVNQATWLSWGGFLGLILFNARNIVQRDNYRGSIIVLLITTGLLVASEFSQRQWKLLLTWLGFSLIPVVLFFVIQVGAEGFGQPALIYRTYYELVQPSMGSINRLATLSTFLTLAAWYTACVSRALWLRGSFLLITALGYWISVGTDSRMAIIAIPSAIVLPWLLLRLGQRLNRSQRLLTSLASIAFSAVLAWELVVRKSFMTSDTMRLRMASCWIKQGFLSNAERFLMGRGFDTSALREACQHVRPGASFGHAHNTLAQVAGNHGLLGLITLGALCLLIVHGLWLQSQNLTHNLAWSPWQSTSWFEISLGLNLSLLICALSTTVQEFSPVNQLLIGLIAGSSRVASGSSNQQERSATTG